MEYEGIMSLRPSFLKHELYLKWLGNLKLSLFEVRPSLWCQKSLAIIQLLSHLLQAVLVLPMLMRE